MLAALKYDVSIRRTDGLETNQQFNQMIQTSSCAYLSYANNYGSKKLDTPCDSSASCINEPWNQHKCCNIRQTSRKMRILHVFAFCIKQHKSSSVTCELIPLTCDCTSYNVAIAHAHIKTIWCAAQLTITRCTKKELWAHSDCQCSRWKMKQWSESWIFDEHFRWSFHCFFFLIYLFNCLCFLTCPTSF